LQYSNTYFLLGPPAPVTINSVTSSASPFTYPVTAADVKGTSTTNGINYNVYSFTTVSTTTSYTVNYSCLNATTIYVLAVGGGGGGGSQCGGGGGAGGVVMMPVNIPAGSSTIVVNVGAGGNGAGANANNAVAGTSTTVTFNANISANIIAFGGGQGGNTGFNGASGGGGGTGTPGQSNNNNYNYGNIGGVVTGTASTNIYSGGGGGAGTAGGYGNGSVSGNGGNGIQCFLPGINNFAPSGTIYSNYYWGGGGGGGDYTIIGGNGGLGGGGGGGINGTVAAGTGTGGGINTGGNGSNNGGAGGIGGANTGSGGGGAYIAVGGNGGSGIVIIAFPSATAVTSNQSAVLPASIVSSGLYSATLNNINLSSLAYNTIKGAFACRLLNYNYFGPIMTLRCSTDLCGNNTQNFYSDICGNMGTGYMGTGQSVSTWLSGQAANTTYAFVTKWYGQGMDVSFNSAYQYTTNYQPLYDVSNGFLNFGYNFQTGTASSLTNWTNSNCAISNTVFYTGSNPTYQLPTGYGNYCYINTNVSILGSTITFNVNTGSLCDVLFGCNSSGLGQYFRIGGSGWDWGFSNSTTWSNISSPAVSPTGIRPIAINTWCTVVITITTTGLATFTVNGVTNAASYTITNNGTYFGLQADGATGSSYFYNIMITPTQSNCFFNLPNASYPIGDSSLSYITRLNNLPSSGANMIVSIGGASSGSNNNAMYLYANGTTQVNTYFGATNVTITSTWVPNTAIAMTYNNAGGTASRVVTLYENINGTESLTSSGNPPNVITSISTYNTLGAGNNAVQPYQTLNGQMYNFYSFQSALSSADRLLVEATPYQYSVLPAITGLSATQVTSTTFVLGWSTVSNAQTYALWINGSYFATYSAPALTTGTVTPTSSGPWILNLYAYNSANVLLATGSTGAAVMAGAILTANSGATQTTNGTNTVFTFTSSGTFTAATTGYASVLIVGGGGGGGNNYGGGGGAGGLVYFDTNYKPMLLTAGTSYTVTVGTGGGGGAGTGGRGANGLDSTFNGYIAKGGGGGSYNNGGNAAVTGVDGGCGGGSNNIATPGGSTQPTYANAFYVGGFSGGVGSSVNMVTGGGGGAGGLGGAPTSSATVSGVGGPGYSCNIIGTPTYYGGGGGGGAYQYTGGSGGVGGGGNGGSSTAGSNGTANTGGGGGGSNNAGTGYTGGSGVVIISCQGLTTIAGLATSSVTATNFVLSWTNVANISYILFINGTKYGTVTTGSTITPTTTGPWTLGLYGYNASNVLSYYGTTNSLLIASITNNGFPATLFPFWSNTTNYATNANDGSTFGTACVYTSATGYKAGVGSLSQPTVTGGFLTNPITYTSGAAISFGGWFNITSSGIFCHISMNGGSNRYFLNNTTGINLGWNGVGVGGAQGASSSAFTSYTNGTWIHIIVVIPSSGNTVAYVNGSLVATPLTSTTISPGATFTNVNTVLFGLNGPSAGVSGYINNFYIFNRTLSATEVTALYNQ